MGTSADSWRRACSDGQLGYQQHQEGRREVQEAKLNLDRTLETPEKLLGPYVRSETANSQHLVEKILTMKVFMLKDSYELK